MACHYCWTIKENHLHHTLTASFSEAPMNGYIRVLLSHPQRIEATAHLGNMRPCHTTYHPIPGTLVPCVCLTILHNTKYNTETYSPALFSPLSLLHHLCFLLLSFLIPSDFNENNGTASQRPVSSSPAVHV